MSSQLLLSSGPFGISFAYVHRLTVRQEWVEKVDLSGLFSTCAWPYSQPGICGELIKDPVADLPVTFLYSRPVCCLPQPAPWPPSSWSGLPCSFAIGIAILNYNTTECGVFHIHCKSSGLPPATRLLVCKASPPGRVTGPTNMGGAWEGGKEPRSPLFLPEVQKFFLNKCSSICCMF